MLKKNYFINNNHPVFSILRTKATPVLYLKIER